MHRPSEYNYSSYCYYYCYYYCYSYCHCYCCCCYYY